MACPFWSVSLIFWRRLRCFKSSLQLSKSTLLTLSILLNRVYQQVSAGFNASVNEPVHQGNVAVLIGQERQVGHAVIVNTRILPEDVLNNVSVVELNSLHQREFKLLVETTVELSKSKHWLFAHQLKLGLENLRVNGDLLSQVQEPLQGDLVEGLDQVMEQAGDRADLIVDQ